MYKIHGFIKDYAWGGFDFIPHLLGQESTGKPAAELWFGDHPQGASQLEDETGKTHSLEQWIAAHGDVFSVKSREKFGAKLPFLLKILDVRLPLSIQLHPNKEQAEAGFQREEAAGIPRDSAERNYQDDNHKPEMMVALSEFWLLHGFAPREVMETQLSARPSLAPVLDIVRRLPLQEAYAKIMTASQTDLAAWLEPILNAPAPLETSADPDYWLHYTVRAMNIAREKLDPGLLSFYLLNIVCLEKGEGIFQAARLPHAYLRGQNIEIMAASNNVLRAGLTPKHIDIAELLRIIDAQSITPAIIKAPKENLSHYPVPIADFTLDTLQTAGGDNFSIRNPEFMIVLNLHGRLFCKSKRQTLSLKSGEAALIPAGEEISCQCENRGLVVFASTQSPIVAPR